MLRNITTENDFEVDKSEHSKSAKELFKTLHALHAEAQIQFMFYNLLTSYLAHQKQRPSFGQMMNAYMYM